MSGNLLHTEPHKFGPLVNNNFIIQLVYAVYVYVVSEKMVLC